MTTLRTPPESKLGIDLQALRTSRPDEWWMDDFTREAEAMNEQNKALRAALEGLCCSPHTRLTKHVLLEVSETDIDAAIKALDQAK